MAAATIPIIARASTWRSAGSLAGRCPPPRRMRRRPPLAGHSRTFGRGSRRQATLSRRAFRHVGVLPEAALVLSTTAAVTPRHWDHPAMAQLLSRLSGAIYGTLAVAVLLAAETAEGHTYATTVEAASVTLIAYWLTHGHARGLAARLASSAPPSSGGLLRSGAGVGSLARRSDSADHFGDLLACRGRPGPSAGHQRVDGSGFPGRG